MCLIKLVVCDVFDNVSLISLCYQTWYWMSFIYLQILVFPLNVHLFTCFFFLQCWIRWTEVGCMTDCFSLNTLMVSKNLWTSFKETLQKNMTYDNFFVTMLNLSQNNYIYDDVLIYGKKMFIIKIFTKTS
jgi:hypothetical protein